MKGKKPKLLLVQPTTVHLDGTPHKTRWRLIMGLMIPLMAGLTPDDYDVTLFGRLLLIEKATLPKRNIHCVEIVGVSHTDAGSESLTRGSFRSPFDLHERTGVWPIERKEVNRSDSLDVGKSLQLANGLFEEVNRLA